MKYRYTRKELYEKWCHYFIGEDELMEKLLATKPTKVKKIKKINFADWRDIRDMDIEIMIENKLNELISAVNRLQTK
ncbi:MAG: hypothetical protein BWY19_01178 [bacterium ADurb.Bin212]|nr:MAG: hypothetical protein BWY19_01178 [bacterium ADurb.Bin212]